MKISDDSRAWRTTATYFRVPTNICPGQPSSNFCRRRSCTRTTKIRPNIVPQTICHRNGSQNPVTIWPTNVDFFCLQAGRPSDPNNRRSSPSCRLSHSRSRDRQIATWVCWALTTSGNSARIRSKIRRLCSSNICRHAIASLTIGGILLTRCCGFQVTFLRQNLHVVL